MEYEQHKQEMEKLDFQSRLREREAIEGRERPNDGNEDEGSIGRAVGKVTPKCHQTKQMTTTDLRMHSKSDTCYPLTVLRSVSAVLNQRREKLRRSS